MRSLAPIICGALFAVSSPVAAQGASGTEAAIRAGTEAWKAAWNAGDAAALASLYAEDATVMAPGQEPAVGRAAIEAGMGSALEAVPGGQMELETLEVMVNDDMAVEIGRFVFSGADGSHVDHGPYVAVWKQVDGKWLLYRDIWNSSMAM